MSAPVVLALGQALDAALIDYSPLPSEIHDALERLNVEGYVLVPADGVLALWHENEHLKTRLAELTEPDRHVLMDGWCNVVARTCEADQ